MPHENRSLNGNPGTSKPGSRSSFASGTLANASGNAGVMDVIGGAQRAASNGGLDV